MIFAAGEDATEYRTAMHNANKAYTAFTAQTGLAKQPTRTKIGITTECDKAAANQVAENRTKFA